jgi:hypothetical protein
MVFPGEGVWGRRLRATVLFKKDFIGYERIGVPQRSPPAFEYEVRWAGFGSPFLAYRKGGLTRD